MEIALLYYVRKDLGLLKLDLGLRDLNTLFLFLEFHYAKKILIK